MWTACEWVNENVCVNGIISENVCVVKRIIIRVGRYCRGSFLKQFDEDVILFSEEITAGLLT